MDVPVTGLSAFGRVGNALVWGVVVPDQDPNYNPLIPGAISWILAQGMWVDAGQWDDSAVWKDDEYIDVTPNQTPSYVAVVPTTSSGYNAISPGQNPSWVPVAT